MGKKRERYEALYCPNDLYIISIQERFWGKIPTEAMVALLAKENRLSVILAKKIVRFFCLRLLKMRLAQQEPALLCRGWHIGKDRAFYFPLPDDERIAFYSEEMPSRTAIGYTGRDIACIFFAATVFSLLKTPLRRLKILSKEETDFALYVHASHPVEPERVKESLSWADHYAGLFCNFRKWGRKKRCGDFDCGVFRQELQRGCSSLSWWNHLCFPAAFADYPREEDMEDIDFDDPVYPGAVPLRVQWMKKEFENLSCLPILLLQKSVSGEEASDRKNISPCRIASGMAQVYHRIYVQQ